MLGLDVCEFGGQVLELLWLTMCYRGLLADKKDQRIEDEEDERHLNYVAPLQKSLEEIRQLDKDDQSLVKYKRALLGTETMPAADPVVARVQVTRLTLLCEEAPEPISRNLKEDLSALKEKTLSLKEGVTYRLKIHFKVRAIHAERTEGFALHPWVHYPFYPQCASTRHQRKAICYCDKPPCCQRTTRPIWTVITPMRRSGAASLVNREIVAGLRYHHVTSRKGITVDKVSHMVGSYCPKEEEHEFLCPADQVPGGVMSRGRYTVKSRLTDDDKNTFLDWEWNFELNKDWSE
uniref:Rho GDP dissociation inhibitor (GDI) gamma n=1 Tax=Gasterosteus aculeatus aculeatus TaxID=481459 RepID=A0AAQ4S5F9_GASAC